MGNKERAKRISSKLEGGPLIRSMGEYMFDKCGNCDMRVKCIVVDTLESGGVDNALGVILKDFKDLNCDKCNRKKKKINSIVANGIKNSCGECDRFPMCVEILCREAGCLEITNQIIPNAKKCINCPELQGCIDYYMDELNLSKSGVITKMFVKKFGACSKGKKQKPLTWPEHPQIIS